MSIGSDSPEELLHRLGGAARDVHDAALVLHEGHRAVGHEQRERDLLEVLGVSGLSSSARTQVARTCSRSAAFSIQSSSGQSFEHGVAHDGLRWNGFV